MGSSSRRSFLRTLGAGAAATAFPAASGLVSWAGNPPSSGPEPILLNRNENAYGASRSAAAAMREAAGPELHSVSVFDEYRGEQIGAGKRSLAFRVAFGSPERTLTDEEAAVLRGRIVDALAKRFGAALRA